MIFSTKVKTIFNKLVRFSSGNTTYACVPKTEEKSENHEK